MKLWPVVTGVAIALTLVACKSPTPPKGVQPISGFDASRYLGKWYEVARLENRFERGLGAGDRHLRRPQRWGDQRRQPRL